MSKLTAFIVPFICAIGFYVCGYMWGYGAKHTSGYVDGTIVCVVAGQPDVMIYSPKIMYLGEGRWEFLTSSGKMSIFERGSMSSCFIATRPKEIPNTDKIDRDTPPPLDPEKYNL